MSEIYTGLILVKQIRDQTGDVAKDLDLFQVADNSVLAVIWLLLLSEEDYLFSLCVFDSFVVSLLRFGICGELLEELEKNIHTSQRLHNR